MECKTLASIFKHLFKFSLVASLSFSAQAQFSVEQGYVRAMPAGATHSAAYLTLLNLGEPARLVQIQVDSRIAKRASLHTLIEDQGVIRMRQLEDVDIPAAGRLELSQGGNHIMLMGLASPLKIGQQIELTLIFANKQPQTVSLIVK